MLLFLTACTPTHEPAKPADTDVADTDDGAPYEVPAVEVVQFDTEDGVTLEADWYAHEPGCLGVLLLHMVPPNYDRTSWPVTFIDALRADGRCVLALDRRGASGSGGEAVDAYSGPKGKHDARAAVTFMKEHGIGDLAIIAASNGTTTGLDYTVTAAPDFPVPVSMIWMSPGAYTVGNRALSELTFARLLMMYPSSEAEWPEAQTTADTWRLLEYARGSHGTGLFDTQPKTTEDIRTWLAGGDPTAG